MNNKNKIYILSLLEALVILYKFP
ncbi:uncharacterized protein Dmoj_GI25999 [Drosophila mojavensis]|uniref:Uncharacterized protein n=1 Tax=Drosophila mojavensis TaxID=7230 RepID=A0A0Q9X331_DROMO|nr:uncharacterized protein Dmoj_GI25999 [Drosophila mojavensis]